MAVTIGVIGLGIMGGTFARHLLEAGERVLGCDPDPAKMARFTAAGGIAAASPAEMAREARVILTLLPSEAALEAVVDGPDGLCAAGTQGFILVECGTLPLEAKTRAAERLAAIGAEMLDCPISGTGQQAANKDLSFYASGREDSVETVRPVLAKIGRDVFYLGAFGNGIKTKFIANLLVAIHNVAAAEALTLARKAGLDVEQVLATVAPGAGGSRMLQVRGPMMIAGSYGEGDSARLDVFRKDLRLISAFCAESGGVAPVFNLCSQLYHAAIAQGFEAQDPGAVCRVIEHMSGLDREG